jgi:hypothetical protein
MYYVYIVYSCVPYYCCPAKDAECNKCHKRSHFSARCHSKTVSDVVDMTPPDNPMDYNMLYLGAVESEEGTVWNCTICVNGREIPFKVDMGAEDTIIIEAFANSCNSVTFSPLSKHGPDNNLLEGTGEVKEALLY